MEESFWQFLWILCSASFFMLTLLKTIFLLVYWEGFKEITWHNFKINILDNFIVHSISISTTFLKGGLGVISWKWDFWVEMLPQVVCFNYFPLIITIKILANQFFYQILVNNTYILQTIRVNLWIFCNCLQSSSTYLLRKKYKKSLRLASINIAFNLRLFFLSRFKKKNLLKCSYQLFSKSFKNIFSYETNFDNRFQW